MPVLYERRIKIKELPLSGRRMSTTGQTPAFTGSHRFNSGLTMADERDPVVSSIASYIVAHIGLPTRHFDVTAALLLIG
jgi:hypothetical protein